MPSPTTLYVNDESLVPARAATTTTAAFHATLLVIAAYVAIGIALLAVADVPGPVVPGLSAFFAAGVFVTEISTSFLLLVYFRADPTWSLLILTCA
jgi:hypothetical protein